MDLKLTIKRFMKLWYSSSVFLFIVLSGAMPIETKAITSQVIVDREYLILKNNFKWLDEHNYNIIKNACNKYKVDIKYACSVIQYESGDYCNNDWFKMSKVVSRAGAIGPFQIMPFHVKNKNTLYNFEVNAEKGAWYLSLCIEKAKKLKIKYNSIANKYINKYKKTGSKKYLNYAKYYYSFKIEKEASRMYNAGLYNKRWKYKNWKYVNRIYNKYNSITSSMIAMR